MSEKSDLRDGEPCGHKGCLSHVTHPCEGCGRIGGRKHPMSDLRERAREWVNAVWCGPTASKLITDLLQALDDAEREERERCATIKILHITQTINGNHRVVLAALDQRQVVGTADIAWSDKDEPVLCNVFVAEEYRGKGIGKQLVDAATEWASRRSVRLWIRVTPGRLVTWYERFGFKETGEMDGECLWMLLAGTNH